MLLFYGRKFSYYLVHIQIIDTNLLVFVIKY